MAEGFTSVPGAGNQTTLAVLAEDSSGVLSQITRLFSRKGYNIHSLTSGETQQENLRRMTITIEADAEEAEQIAAQCRKLIPVRGVKILPNDYLGFRMVMMKYQVPTPASQEMALETRLPAGQHIQSFQVEDVITFVFAEEVGSTLTQEIQTALADCQLLELVRTGTVALERDNHTIYDNQKLKEEYNYGKNVLREGL